MSTSVTGFLKSVTARDGFELRIHARGKRIVLWVGKLSLRSQREYERHVASIVDSFRSGGSIDPLDMKWASSLPERIRDKLVAWQMIPAVSVRSVSPDQRTVGGWTQLYIDEMVSENPRTKDNYGQARNWLVKSIESKKDIAAVTLGDLQRWQRSMKPLALSTRNKHVQRVKTMFEACVSDGVIEVSPAAKLKEERPLKRIDRTKQQFVNAEDTKRVFDSLPNTTWKLMFALMRFQGLRRHEMFAIQWSHVDWARNELTIPPDTKTGQRTMPIFKEVLPLMRDAFEMDCSRVVQWDNSQESVTELLRKRVAKVLGKCWPKPCHQLRSTRRTELDRMFPSYIINEWLGHDGKTAEKHYQQITPADLVKAAELETVDLTGSVLRPVLRNGTQPEENQSEPLRKDQENTAFTSEKHPRQDSNLRPTD